MSDQIPLRELAAKEKRDIRRLVTTECAYYDNEYGCLRLDGACYMFTIGFASSSLCRYFKVNVLPQSPELEAVFCHLPVKPCKWCGGR